jgi:hypothetical protein
MTKIKNKLFKKYINNSNNHFYRYLEYFNAYYNGFI